MVHPGGGNHAGRGTARGAGEPAVLYTDWHWRGNHCLFHGPDGGTEEMD